MKVFVSGHGREAEKPATAVWIRRATFLHGEAAALNITSRTARLHIRSGFRTILSAYGRRRLRVENLLCRKPKMKTAGSGAVSRS